MAKKSAIEKNEKRRRMVVKYADKRAELKVRTRSCRRKNGLRHVWRWRRCHAIRHGPAFAIAAN